MIQFSELFPDAEIVVTVSRQLTWSHFLAIIPLKGNLQRDFYTQMCLVEIGPYGRSKWPSTSPITYPKIY